MDLTNAQLSTVFSYATEQGRTIVYLHYLDLIVCAIIASLVAGLLVAVVLKFRKRPGDSEPEQVEGNVKYEVTWTAIPALILLVMGILTAIVMNTVNPPVKAQKPDIIVNAHQWWWEYSYPKTGVVTANELYMPEGKNYLLEIRAADVDHSFWVPDFGQKMDAIPGHPNFVFYKPIRKGLFTGSCAEFCGAQHALMRILVNVVSQKDFDEWTKKQLEVPAAPTTEEAQRGEQLFLSKSCVQCHRIAGTAAQARVGPDLTHLADRQTIGSGLLANSTENVTRWVKNPQKIKPGSYMPDMRLSDKDAHDIALYLESLK